ncbi:MAG: mono/diheme cytochrome c family protein [Verrucomicrobiales bacterium]
MRNRRSWFAIAAIALVALIASGCAQEVGLPDDADAELIAGQDVFRARCAQCHGVDGGGGIGFSLRAIEDRLTDVEQRSVVVDGRKAMPSFRLTLTEGDIEAVVRYTREILSNAS